MLAPVHLYWNLPSDRRRSEVEQYMSEVAAFASGMGFFASESQMSYYPCDVCRVPVPLRHIQFLNYEMDSRRCFECMEDEYDRDGEGPALVPPDILERFRDKGATC